MVSKNIDIDTSHTIFIIKASKRKSSGFMWGADESGCPYHCGHFKQTKVKDENVPFETVIEMGYPQTPVNNYSNQRQ